MAISPESYKNVIDMLQQKNIAIVDQMDLIHVLLIETSQKKANALKGVPGVISIEPEGTVTAI